MRIVLVSLAVFFGVVIHGNNGATTTASYLSSSDRARLKQVFSAAWELKDLPAVHYAVLGYKLLGESIPKSQEICRFLSGSLNNVAVSPEMYYYVTSAWQALGACGNLPVDKISKALGEVVEKDTSSVAELYYAVQALNSIGQKRGEAAKLIKTLQAALKKDDSLLNLGYSFHIAALLGADGTFAFDRIEDAIVQADEVDSRFLQFEGGLSITALLVSGAYKLANTVNKPPPITGDQAVKFANYFLSRRSVQTAKGAYSLLEVVNTLTNNKFHLPVAITLASQAAVSLEQPRVSVKVSDLLGRPLSNEPLTVTAESATRVGDEVVVLSKKKFEPTTGDNTLYSMNLMETKPERGLYKLSVSAALAKPDPRMVGNVGASLTVKVMCAVGVENVEVGTVDADQTTQAKLARVTYPNKLSASIEADSLQKLIMKFALKDKNSGKLMTVHQAFVRLHNAVTDQEIIFVAEPDSSKAYKFDIFSLPALSVVHLTVCKMAQVKPLSLPFDTSLLSISFAQQDTSVIQDVGSKAVEFGYLSGLYTMELIVGDAVLSNSFSWKVANVNLKFAEQAPASNLQKDPYLYAPKPEIKHLFREPERRPPAVVSNLFTGLVGVPFLLLFILWAKLGVNISNFPFSISALGFHLGLGAIFALFGVFWLQLNMFQTIKYLLALGVITFLCGNKLLAKIASDRKHR